MVKFNCPSCGAEIIFQSSISVYAVCKSCGSTVVRRDQDIEMLGQMAQLPADISPLQIGTSGLYHKAHFSIVGRTKMGWADGSWNEWFILTDSGTKGWLAEAQGFFSVSIEEHPETDASGVVLPFPFPTAPPLGQIVPLHNGKFRVTDIKEAICLGSEGELPFVAHAGRKATYVDMLSDTGKFAGIEYSDEPPRLYYGAYVNFEDLAFANLRELDGWKAPRHDADTAGDPKTVTHG